MVHQGNRSVSGVHGAQNQHIGRDAKKRASSQRNGMVTVFEQIEQLAKDPRQIGPVDLVDDQHTATTALLGLATELQKAPRLQSKLELTTSRGPWPQALHEI